MIQKKIAMVGAFAVGKTSLVRRFVSSIYADSYQTTVGVKVDKKEVTVHGTPVNLVLWDVQGEDELQKLKLVYLRGAAGYLLVADGLRAATLDVAQAIQQKVALTLGPVPFVLVINKADRAAEWEIEAERIEALRARGWPVLLSSARNGTGVEEAFGLLAELLLSGRNG